MERKLKLLVVDDDELIHESLDLTVAAPWEIHHVFGTDPIPNQLFHAAFVDLHLKGNIDNAEGIEVIKKLSQSNSQIEIVAISGNLSRPLMEESLKAGATRFLGKPLGQEEVQSLLDKLEAFWTLREVTHRSTSKWKWIGQSGPSERIRRSISQLRGEAGPILIEGESGTGKEVTAQLLHEQEPKRPFVSVNIAAIPENLFESELFGHVKGAFTGADTNKVGLIEAAHGGDLFLDEIEALTLPLQAKLLRFLEDYQVRRVGGSSYQKVDVRIIAATNENLSEMVSDKRFREDLMWRLCGKRIQLPPLRDRAEDIEHLSRHFIQMLRPRVNKTFDSSALEIMKTYSWPGNVRELRRICEQLGLISPLPIIRAEDVRPLLGIKSSSGKNPSVNFADLDLKLGLPRILQDYEKKTLEYALATVQDIDDLSKMLKISRSSLYKKIKDHQIQSRG